MNCEDLEDGEIEDDDEEEVQIVETKKEKDESSSKKNDENAPSPNRKPNDSKKTLLNKKDKTGQEEDDFMSNIESKIANVLKEKGLEPPMPSIKKADHSVDLEQQKSSSSRASRKRRKRKERKDQKRDNASSKVCNFFSPKSLVRSLNHVLTSIVSILLSFSRNDQK